MAYDAFLKIDGIPGESTDKTHKGEIEILSFSWGLTQSGSVGGSGGGAGKVSFQDMSFTSKTQASSPLLALFCASGKHIANALLTLRKGGQDPSNEFVKITLQDVLISSFEEGGDTSSSDRPTDSFAMNFGKIEFDEFPQAASGTTSQPVVFKWDVSAQKQG